MSEEDKVGDKAKGIIDSLEEEEERENISSESESKKVKRTYMLTKDQVRKLHNLKLDNSGVSLSEIVGEAIEEYYSKYS